MKRENYLDHFRFDLHITGADNGALVEFPEVQANNTVILSRVATSKEEILAIIKNKLDEFYRD